MHSADRCEELDRRLIVRNLGSAGIQSEMELPSAVPVYILKPISDMAAHPGSDHLVVGLDGDLCLLSPGQGLGDEPCMIEVG